MIECPNCGGNLKYSIEYQKMLCGHCNVQFDPYKVAREQDGEEHTDFEVSVFTCPQCAGEIYSTDNSVAGFCSFCGASTILSSRLQRENKPEFVVPFKVSKEACKDAYIKMMRRAIYAPKELKSKRHIREFRGIYMPYWVYHVTQQGEVFLKGKTEEQKGDYLVTRYYNIEGEMDTYYKGLAYDASSSFADNISEKLAPYDVKNMKEFTPSFLSGFYADLPDVKAAVYEEDAKRVATNRTQKRISETVIPDLTQDTEELMKALHTEVKSADTALLPVWFMSYRNRDRVAYATVNGQTGKVVADIPVDFKKYLLGCLIGAAPLFVLFNLFLTIRPSTLLAVVTVLAAIVLVLYCQEMKQIAVKDGYRDDKGLIENRKERKKERAEKEAAAALENDIVPPIVVTKEELEEKKFLAKEQKKNRKKNWINVIIVAVVGILIFGGIFVEEGVLEGFHISLIVALTAMVTAITACFNSIAQARTVARKSGMGAVWATLATMLATGILLWNPVSDLYYYAGVMITMAAVLFTLIDLIMSYNILATRRLPQFDYQGGDDRA